MVSQSQIALLSHTRLMDFHARFLTSRAHRLGTRPNDLDTDGAIRLPFVFEHMQSRQIQWDDDASSGGFFCGLLVWQGLFSLISVVLVFPRSTKNKPFPPLFSPGFLQFPPKGWRALDFSILTFRLNCLNRSGKRPYAVRRFVYLDPLPRRLHSDFDAI
jgi:hypothetical protein